VRVYQYGRISCHVWVYVDLARRRETAGRYELEVATERVPVEASLRPFYDPTGGRIRS
jgi:hypothetical protein